MKNKFFYFKVLSLLSFFIFFNYSFIQAQNTVNVNAGNIWSEYISNPLFGGPTDGTNRGYYPCVIKVGSTYHIWYGDGSNTRHAVSSSPNFSGATFPAPIVTGITLPAYHPHVLYNASGWDVGGTHYAGPFLLYSPTSDWTHVYIFHSADGDSWTSIGEVTGVHNYGGHAQVYNLDVVYEGGTTWKAYADNGLGLIQYYVSTDGKNWTGTAINILGNNYQPWESNHSYTAPHVIKENGAYIMFFGSGTTNNNQAFGMAISTDGQNFIKSNGNPIFTTSGTPPSWRDERTYTPYVVQDGTNWLIYYTGKNLSTGNYSIGYATNTGLYWLIQDAINAASPTWTVSLAAGTYPVTSTINVNKALTITGPGTGVALVQGTNSSVVSVFEISASDVTLQNLEITHTALPVFVSTGWTELPNSLIRIPVQTTGFSNLNIINNKIYVPLQSGAMSTWNGVAITVGAAMANSINITGNTIHNTRNGVVLHYNNMAVISNNIIYDTKGGIMNYTNTQADANNRTMANNTWSTTHNEWDIVWNSAYYVPDYQQSVLALSSNNNSGYVLDRRAADAAACAALTGNRSHIFVNASGTIIAPHPARGNFNEPFKTLALGIEAVVPGGKVLVAAGTYTESGQIVINKNINIIGADKLTTIIKTNQNTGNSGNSRGWFLVNTGCAFNISNVTLDGTGYNVYQGIRNLGTGIIDNCKFYNIKYPGYMGVAVAVMGGPTPMNVTLSNCTFSEIGRIGVIFFGTGITASVFTNCTYLGKGNGDWLDYAVEFGGGAIGSVTNLTASQCKGVALSDGSTSAGILVTTYYGSGTNATITGSTLTDNTTGIAVGYDASDVSICVAHNNNISNNTSYGIQSTHPVVNATANWWGDATGPYHLTLNPTGTGNAVSDYVNFTPWVGSIETHNVTNANLNTPVNFTSCNTSMTFTSLPGGTNANVSVQRIESSNPPTGVPGFPRSSGQGLPLYLMISATGLTNYTFSVTVVVDVSNINGFNPNTKVMYFSTASNSWVGIQGVYSPSAKTFTFTTDHFTPFGFVNPENPNDIYLAQVITDPVNTQKWYPAVGMGGPNPPDSPDWKYSNATATFYVVPTGTTGMYGSKFSIVWDKSKANISVTAGNFWDSQFPQIIDSSNGNNGRVWVNITSQDLTNQVPESGRHLAVINISNLKPGYMPVSIDGTDFRYYHSNGDSTSGVYATTHPGKVLFYLGDVCKTLNQTIGDGKINFEDLSIFSAAYWSINGTHPAYKYKCDIGPTNASGSYWALPTPDGRIEFEDLVIFSIGYGKTGAGQLPDNPGENKMKVSTLAMKYENGYMKVPVKVSGVVKDFRAGSFEFSYSSSELEFAGFEKKGGFEGDDNFMLSKAENNKIMLDAAIVGAEKDGMNGEQVIMNLLFTEKQQGKHNVGILSARARNSGNTPIEVVLDGNGVSSELPTVFSLDQNYPNPFNPVTTIKYGLPKDVKVSIVVFDILGREVITLANEYQKAGYHQVEFRGDRLASGTYFYRLVAGDFTSIKKMVLIK